MFKSSGDYDYYLSHVINKFSLNIYKQTQTHAYVVTYVNTFTYWGLFRCFRRKLVFLVIIKRSQLSVLINYLDCAAAVDFLAVVVITGYLLFNLCFKY